MVGTIDVVGGASYCHGWIKYLSVLIVTIIFENLLIPCLRAPASAREIVINLATIACIRVWAFLNERSVI